MAAKINPLLHYIVYGKKENRLIKSENFQPQFVGKNEILKQKQAILLGFLQSGEQIDLTYSGPQLTVILVLFNRAELTLACLQSLHAHANVPLEVIIIDNNSTDETATLLRQVKVARVIKNNENLHFLSACNQAVEYVSTPNILFLNNDTEIAPNALFAALETLNQREDHGAVGGKIILPDGSLQEAGCIIWRDGSTQGYGRGDNPQMPEYNFKRVVDYCSGAFLLTRTELFKKQGGFDTRFAPAYYEETDYCLRLRKNGYKVIYDPFAEVSHFEFGSSGKSRAVELQQVNKEKFRMKHADILKYHFEPLPENVLKARFSASSHHQGNMLYIDDHVPHKTLGAGYPRSNLVLNTIAQLGFRVTLFPNTFPQKQEWKSSYADIDPSIEIIFDHGFQKFGKFILDRLNYYEIIWISRPHNLEYLKAVIEQYGSNSRIIYDAEAIFAERAIQKHKLSAHNSNCDGFDALVKNELDLCKMAGHVVAVSERDAGEFKKHGIENVSVIGHGLQTCIGSKNFAEREGLLFVGNLDSDDSPNVDSIIWFVREVWPIIKKEIPALVFHIVGTNKAGMLQNLRAKDVVFHGMIEDIGRFYDDARVFVAPTRYASGIPYKIHEAASHGLPVVATELLSDQLTWKDSELLLASSTNAVSFADAVMRLYTDEVLWTKIRRNALLEIEANHSKAKIENTLMNLLSKDFIYSALTNKNWSDIKCQGHESVDFCPVADEK